jgi:DNA-binding NarL/FixJ family response regulator
MKIALIDDHRLLTEAIRNTLIDHKQVREVVVYNSAEQFLETAKASDYDIMVLDLMMPGMDGMQLLEICKEDNPAIRTIILSSVTDVQTIKQAIRKGASGFLSKTAPLDELLAAINAVSNAEQYIGDSLKKSLLNTMFVEEQTVYHFSPREKDVLQLVCSGLTIKEIAYELDLSVHTVQYYHRNVMKKLNLHRTADLIVFAMQHGLYIPDIDTK